MRYCNAIEWRDLVRSFRKTLVNFQVLSETPLFNKERERIYKKYSFNIKLVKKIWQGHTTSQITNDFREICGELSSEFPQLREKSNPYYRPPEISNEDKETLEKECAKIPSEEIKRFSKKWRIRRVDALFILKKDEWPPYPVDLKPRSKKKGSKPDKRKWWAHRIHPGSDKAYILKELSKGRKPLEIVKDFPPGEETVTVEAIYKIQQRHNKRIGQ